MVFKWSTTASANDTADPTVNWREGQAPSTVNDSARSLMARVAQWRDDLDGKLLTGGTSTAFSLTTAQNITGVSPIPDGFTLRARMSATSGAAPTLNVDSTGAKAIQSLLGTAVPTGALQSGGVYDFVYNQSSDVWLVGGVFDYSQFLSFTPTGVMSDYIGTSAPSGWILASGRTIGDGSSGATERANADTSALFALLWNAYSNTICPVSGGRGLSAAADFAAHKTITLLDLRGRATVGKDDMGGTAALLVTAAVCGVDGTGLGNAGGEQAHTLLVGELAVHSHTPTESPHHHSLPFTQTAFANPGSFAGSPDAIYGNSTPGVTGSASTGISIGNTGSGNAHNNMQPFIIMNKIIKL